MKVVYNLIIPVKGFIAINLFGIVFVRKELAYKFTDDVINHEQIHTAQQKELWYIGFYLIYLAEWIYRLIFHTKTAYRGISFEKEARENQYDLDYLKTRVPFAMWK